MAFICFAFGHVFFFSRSLTPLYVFILIFLCACAQRSHRALRKRAIPETHPARLTSMQRWSQKHSSGIQARKKIPVKTFNSYIRAYLDDTTDEDDEVESITLSH